MTTYDILQDECVQDILRMKEREELLSKYDRKIWQGKNGKWYTYLPSDNGGRKQIKRNSKKKILRILSYSSKNRRLTIQWYPRYLKNGIIVD